MEPVLSIERACEENANLNILEKTPVEVLFEPIDKKLSFFLFKTNRPNKKILNRISQWVQYIVILISVYITLYALYILSSRQLTDLTTVIFFMTICVISTAVSADVSSLKWQRSNTIANFFQLLHSASNGKGVQKNRKSMDGLNRLFGAFTWLIISYSVAFDIYLAIGEKPEEIEIDEELFMNMMYFKELMIVDNLIFCYLMIGLSLQIHIYCFCIRAVTLEINYFISEAIETKCLSESEAIDFFTRSIERNAKLSTAVRLLDKTFKKFAFIQVGMVIPCTLFVVFGVIIRRDAPLLDLMLSFVHVVICMFLFHVLTFYPAQLHAQIKKTRGLFCTNIRQWFSYGPKVHTAALLFSSHLEQNDLGVTLWGFALLSKPLILTGLSAMSTALAIFLQFSDCKKQIIARMIHQNISYPDTILDL